MEYVQINIGPDKSLKIEDSDTGAPTWVTVVNGGDSAAVRLNAEQRQSIADWLNRERPS